MNLYLTPKQIKYEIERIITFISEQLSSNEKAVIGVSGGLDSDVVARLTAKAIGGDRLKLFVVIQQDMDPNHLLNARSLANELKVNLVEINLVNFPFEFIKAMQQGDPIERFKPDGLLDPSRAKCSIRTVIFSTYQDRGYVVVGTSNRTEFETGFFLPLGDGLAHIKPIIHLYKSQIRQIGETIGSNKKVLDQPASAGFWLGEEDLEDTAYWLYNQGPIGQEIDFNEAAEKEVLRIRSFLTTEALDYGLLGLSQNLGESLISESSQLPIDVINRLKKLTEAAKIRKHRPLGIHIDATYSTTLSQISGPG